MLELKNISKQFGQHKIFDKYNLTVEEGKILAIVGPSGGGKTTLLRMLAGLETIDSGQIIYENDSMYQTFCSIKTPLCIRDFC